MDPLPAPSPTAPRCQSAAVEHPVADLRVLLANNPIPAPAVAMRRAAALAVGGYPAWLRVGEDYMLYVNLMRAGWRFAYVPRACAVYRWPEPGRHVPGPAGHAARRRGCSPPWPCACPVRAPSGAGWAARRANSSRPMCLER